MNNRFLVSAALAALCGCMTDRGLRQPDYDTLIAHRSAQTVTTNRAKFIRGTFAGSGD